MISSMISSLPSKATTPDGAKTSKAWAAFLVLGIGLGTTGCGEGGSTEPTSPPSTLVPVTVPDAPLVVGGATDPPISVRVEDAFGNPVEGIPVRFDVLRGEGLLGPGVAVSSAMGVAETTFEAAMTPGEAEVLVDIPSFPAVEPFSIFVSTEVADSVFLEVVGGTAQQAEAGTQLPLPFVVQATTGDGATTAGVALVFRLQEEEESGASVTHVIRRTGAHGRAHSVLTLGPDPGSYQVDVFAAGNIHSDTVTLDATAVLQMQGSTILDSVGGSRLVAGETNYIYGTGFQPTPDDNDVRVEGIRAAVISVADDRMLVTVPTFADACLPTRDVGIRVLAGGEASNGLLLPLQPGGPQLELEPGERVSFRDPNDMDCLHLPIADEEREYLVLVANTAREDARPDVLEVTTTVADGRVGSPGLAPSFPADGALLEAARGVYRSDAAIRAAAIDHLLEERVGVARASVASGGPRTPAVDDTLSYLFPVRADLGPACADPGEAVRGVVRFAGSHLTLIEDVNAPRGGPTAEEWESVATILDGIVIPSDTSWFGPYEDLDGNSHVVVLVTPRVNQLSGGQVGGFFTPLDLASSGRGREGSNAEGSQTHCAASNEGEILYLASADPDGTVGQSRTTDSFLAEVPRIVAHELQHLINAQRRVLSSPSGFAVTEAVWLDEGLSSLAEELAGHRAADQTQGSNYTLREVTADGARTRLFRTYQRDNFLALSTYMQGPHSGTMVPTRNMEGDDGLRVRGFGWLFVRWLADRSSEGSRALFQSLVGGGRSYLRGVENVERVTGTEWASLLADFGVAMATDDAGVLAGNFQSEDGIEVPEGASITTWNLREVFAPLSEDNGDDTLLPSSFPLRTLPLGFETVSRQIVVGVSNTEYMTLRAAAEDPPLSLSLRGVGGRRLDEDRNVQVTIVRTR